MSMIRCSCYEIIFAISIGAHYTCLACEQIQMKVKSVWFLLVGINPLYLYSAGFTRAQNHFRSTNNISVYNIAWISKLWQNAALLGGNVVQSSQHRESQVKQIHPVVKELWLIKGNWPWYIQHAGSLHVDCLKNSHWVCSETIFHNLAMHKKYSYEILWLT